MKKRTAKNRLQPSLETLDGRCLPAVTSVLSSGVLTITGTDAADVINVNIVSFNSTSGPNGFLWVDGASGFAYTSQISSIRINGLGGADTISIKDPGFWPSSTPAPTTVISGGSGNDTIHGSSSGDQIFGNDGDDVIWGRGGPDIIDGGAGVNTINGVIDAPAPAPPPPPPIETTVPSAPVLPAAAQRIVDLANQERQRVGLAPLMINTRLVQAAEIQTQNMVTSGVMSHTQPGATQPTLLDRINYVGYRFSSAGENIAYGYSSADAVMAAWMNSSGHRANILSANFTEIGVAVAYNSAGRPYYTQVFGRPA